jgi:DnaD/phage-associated family protein
MIRYSYAFSDKRISEAAEFAEASAAELRVLLALIDMDGDADEDELMDRAAISKARLCAALALWEEAGVIRPRDEGEASVPYGNRITMEFAERIIPGELEMQTAAESAITIRRKRLASLFDEIAMMLGKAMLTPMEIKRISSLSAQYSIDEEYIATLAAYLCEHGNFSVNILVGRAKKLAEDGVLTTEMLNDYIQEKTLRDTKFIEFRKLFGIYDRAITKTEEKYFTKWCFELAYGTDVIGVAYDIAVANTNKRDLKYMDKLLCDWHSHGCMTVAACEKRYEAAGLEKKQEEASRRAEQTAVRRATSSTQRAPKPRYGDFDPEEAMRRAIERSYKDTSDSET